MEAENRHILRVKGQPQPCICPAPSDATILCIYCMEGEAIQRLLIWFAGLSRLSCLSNQEDQIGRRNENDPLPATSRIMG